MSVTAAPGEKYTIRQKVFKILGDSFHIFDAQGNIVAFCKQKAFRLREDLRVYTDESQSTELMRIGTRQIIDFSPTFIVTLGDTGELVRFQRRGMRSTFVRDEWEVLSPSGKQIGFVREDGSTALTVARRFIEIAAALFPQSYSLTNEDNVLIATFRQHFNPFIFKMGVRVHADDAEIDELVVLAIGCLVTAIEGRQQ